VGRIASVLLSLEKLKCINSCRVCVPRGSYHPRDYRGRVCVTVSRVDKCGSKGPFAGDWRTMSNAHHCKMDQKGAAREKPAALAIRSVNFLTARTKISWNLFVGRLNYSCQREDDADLHDRSAKAGRPRTAAADHEVLDKTTCKARPSSPNETSACTGSRARSMPLICSPRRGCLYRPHRRHQEPAYRRTGERRMDGLLTAWCAADELPILWMTLSRTRNE
jgi:hypothetical protein